jgi:hypothetical protein
MRAGAAQDDTKIVSTVRAYADTVFVSIGVIRYLKRPT